MSLSKDVDAGYDRLHNGLLKLTRFWTNSSQRKNIARPGKCRFFNGEPILQITRTTEAYKLLLREDFKYMCAYCLLHEGQEQLGGGFQYFQIDHFRPVKFFPALINVYDNLYYACHWCNQAKSDTWPSETAAGRSVQISSIRALRTYTRSTRV